LQIRCTRIKQKEGLIMNIKAEVSSYVNHFSAEVEFSETAVSFYGPAWEFSFFFGLFPIKGKTKELLRIEYDDIEEVVVGKTSTLINKKDACLIKLKSNAAKAKNNPAIEVVFIPFEAGCAMLREKAADRFA